MIFPVENGENGHNVLYLCWEKNVSDRYFSEIARKEP